MPSSPRKREWSLGSVFAVLLPDGSHALGQAVAVMMPNVVYCALTNQTVQVLPDTAPNVTRDNVIARVALTREQLAYGAWTVLGVAPAISRKDEFPNEAFARNGYVGARVYDAAIAEEFLAAFHALVPWDDWHDPRYLDNWLVSPDKKPNNLRYKHSASAS